MKHTVNAVSRRAKIRFNIPLMFLALFILSVGISLSSPFMGTSYATVVEDERQQKDRTILVALVNCMSRSTFYWQPSTTAGQVNNPKNLSTFQGDQDFGQEEVPVGYEIDTDDGNVHCNKISLERAMSFIDKTPRWMLGQIYNLNDPQTAEDPRNGTEYKYYNIKNGDVKKNLINAINGAIDAKGASASDKYGVGPEERKRRLAKAFWLCNEEVPDGQLPERTSNTIKGKTYQLREGKKKDSQISVGMDMSNGDGKYDCNTLLHWSNEDEMAAALASYPRGSGSLDGDDDAAPTQQDIEDNCEQSGVLAWLACPMTSAITTAAGKLDEMINTLLTVNTRTMFCPNKSGALCKDATDENVKSSKAYYKAWSTFRTIALGIIVIASLIVIISTALGYELLDAYTIRKVLPRILIAVIFITLSWSVLSFLITLTNDVGNGIRSIIYAPFVNAGMGGLNVNSFTQYGLLAILGTAGLLSLTVLGLLSFVVTALIAVLIAFFTLILRELLIIMLVLLAPVAIACLILPNTRKMWQLWQNTFVAMLVVFPIISAMIAAGRVFSITVGANDGDLINQVIALVAYIAPYFMIPFAFRAAGGLMATLAGLANDRSRGAFDRLKKYREGEREYKKDRNQRRVIQARSNLNNRLLAAGSNANNGALGRFAARRASKVVGGRNIEALASAKRAAVAKEINDQIATGDDGEIRALTAIKSSRFTDTDGQIKYKTLGGATVTEAQVRMAKSRWGNDSFAQQAALSYEMRKGSSEADLQSIANNYSEVSRGWGMNTDQANGAWIGAAFENQNSHLEYKNMRMGNGINGSMGMDMGGHEKFVNEVYEKRGSYNMSQMGSNTFQELRKAHQSAVASGDTATQQKVQAIAETFMSRYGSGGNTMVGEGDDAHPEVTPGTPGTRGPNYQTNAQGSAHVAERVRQLARDVGVYREFPKGNGTNPATSTSDDIGAPPVDIPPQH